MPRLELLVSPPGTGKTSYCVERFREQIQKSRSGIDSRSYFVLPSREHAGRIQNLLIKKGIAGFFNAHVLTLNELAARFWDGDGLAAPSDFVRTAVVREVLAEESAAGNLAYFSRVADAKGFAGALAAFVSEMHRGLVTVSDFEKWSQPLVADPIFRMKYRDLSVLLKRCAARLHEQGYAELEERWRHGAPPRLSADLVIFDGFYRFTRAQLALLEVLASRSKGVIVTLTAPPDAANHPETFAHVLATRQALEAIGFDACWTAPAVVRRAVHRQILQAPNAREEMRAVAREIRRLYRTTALHWSDCAVIFRSVEPYRKVLESAFAEFDVPVHVHERRRLAEQGLAQTFLRFLRLVRDDWKESDAAYVLRSNLWSASDHPAAGLEIIRAARSAGVRDGRAAWEAAGSIAGLSPSARARLERLLEEEGRVRAARSRPECSRRLRAWLQGLESPEDARVSDALREILERFGRSEDRGAAFDGARACEELIDAIEAALFSEKPRGRNRVQVYDVVMALPKEYKAVFVCGLAEKIFPQEITQDPVLKDAERRAINAGAGRAVLDERAGRLAGERYFFYMATTRAKERLTLTVPGAGLDGRPVLPSIFIDDARRDEPGWVERSVLAEQGAEHWEAKREAAVALALERFRAQGAREPDARIESEAVRRRFADEARVFSASSLESLVACRFKFFASKSLKLEAPPDDREAAARGEVFHQTLQDFFESLTPDERKDAEYWRDPGRLAARAVPMLERRFAEAPFFKRVALWKRAVYRAQMLRAMERFWREESELRLKRPFVPSYFEMKFGYDDPFELGGLRIRGQIDRIDLSPDGKAAWVIDYKSSRTDFVKKIDKGLELQMPLYWLAVEKLLAVPVAGVEHRHLKDGKKPEGRVRQAFHAQVSDLPAWPEEEVEQVLRRTLEDASAAAARLRQADIAVDPKTCKNCDFAAVCRFEQWKLIYREAGA